MWDSINASGDNIILSHYKRLHNRSTFKHYEVENCLYISNECEKSWWILYLGRTRNCGVELFISI